MVNRPFSPGFPATTANWAPGLSDGGGFPHFSSAGVRATCEPAGPWAPAVARPAMTAADTTNVGTSLLMDAIPFCARDGGGLPPAGRCATKVGRACAGSPGKPPGFRRDCGGAQETEGTRWIDT